MLEHAIRSLPIAMAKFAPDGSAIGLLAAALLYAAGIQRLRRRGRSWPLKRTLPFAGGLLMLEAPALSVTLSRAV